MTKLAFSKSFVCICKLKFFDYKINLRRVIISFITMLLKELKILKKIFVSIAVFFYVVLVCLIVNSYLRIPDFYIKTDVVSFLTGAKIIKDGRVDYLYDVNTQFEYQNKVVSPARKKLLPFRNFPITAFVYTPFLEMSLKNSYTVIFVINTALLLIFHLAFIKFFPGASKNKLLFLLPIFFYPSVANLIVGQHTPIILLVFLSIYLLTKRERPLWAGFATSLLMIKPQYLLFTPFPLYLSKNRKQYVLGFIMGVLIFLVLNLMITRSYKPFLNYPNFILSTEYSSYGSRPREMFTLYGLVKQVMPQAKSELLIIGNLFLYVVFAVLTLKRSRILKNSDMLFTSGILLTILFSVHALSHDLLVLLVPLYIGIVNRTRRKGVIFLLYIFPILTLIPSTMYYSLASLGVLFMFLFYSQTIFFQISNN